MSVDVEVVLQSEDADEKPTPTTMATYHWRYQRLQAAGGSQCSTPVTPAPQAPMGSKATERGECREVSTEMPRCDENGPVMMGPDTLMNATSEEW